MSLETSDRARRRLRPLLLISRDLFVIPRLQDVAAALDFEAVLLDGIEAAAREGPPPEGERMLTEPLDGPDAGVLRQVVELQPALILLDIGDPELPTMRWLLRLKTSAATRRVPVVAFGPHVEKDRLAKARELGAELVVARSRLQADLVEILETRALPDRSDTLREGCDRPLSELATRGLDLLDRGEYFEAHELLEQAWLEAEGPQRSLYRSLVQTCVTYLHLQRGNRRGAAKLLLRIHQWLDPLPDHCSGLDVASWKANLRALRAAMDETGDEPTSTIDARLLRPIPKVEP